jgi:ribosomal protein L6P/L9E
MRNKEGIIKWQRSLYRFGSDVDVKLEGRSLSLSGKAGTIKLDLTKLDPSGLMAFKMMEPPAAASSGDGQKRSMMALASPDKRLFGSFVSELDASVRGVTVGYLVGITVKGVGYR